MIDTKPYALFIQNTIKPIIEDLKEILNELDKSGLSLDKEDFDKILRACVKIHISDCFYSALAQIVGWLIIGLIGWMILA